MKDLKFYRMFYFNRKSVKYTGRTIFAFFLIMILCLPVVYLPGCAGHPVEEKTPVQKIETGKTDIQAGKKPLLRECPDVMIINRMPTTKGTSMYYIVKGKRREISEMDTSWIWSNCKYREQIVY